MFGQSRPRISGHADHPNIEAFQGGEDVQQFRGFTAVTGGDDHISVRHDPEVAVQRIDRTQDKRGRPGTGECRGDFFPDLTGFSHPDNDYLSPGLHGLKQ